MKYLILVFTSILFFVTINSKAQVIGGEQDKLFDLFLLEKYADCYFKAIKMIEKEDFKSDPEPYLYISMTLIKIYEDEEMKMEYEDAGGDPLKDALKYATKANKYYSKCLKKDITTFEMEDNMEFFNNLTMIALDEIIYHYNEDKYSKAASWGKKLAKVDPSISEIQLIVAANMLLSKNAEGQKLVDMYWPKIIAKYKSGDVEPDESVKNALIYAIIALSGYYNDNGNSTKAKEIIKFGKDLFVENKKIESQFDSINS
jgi:tetratricopeptide (TPR) repeat protein|tara:strand:+ start:333 stop:1106 length:774 start_codon:yes stop_codon:yes gene_type:complete